MSNCFVPLTRLFLVACIFLLPVTVSAGAPQLQLLGKLRSCDSLTAGIGIDNAGNLFLYKTDLGVVSKFDPYGRKLKHFSFLKGGAGGLAVSLLGDVIYVAVEQKVLILDGDSGQQIGVLGEADGEFSAISAIALDRQGQLYVADGEALSIRVYSPKGRFLYAFTFAEREKKRLKFSAMALDNGNNQLWIALEGQTASVRVYDIRGSLLKEISAESDFGSEPVNCISAMTFDPQGRLYLLDCEDQEIHSFDPRTGGEGHFACEARETMGQASSGLVFDAATSRLFVAIDEEVSIFAVDAGSSQLVVDR